MIATQKYIALFLTTVLEFKSLQKMHFLQFGVLSLRLRNPNCLFVLGRVCLFVLQVNEHIKKTLIC